MVEKRSTVTRLPAAVVLGTMVVVASTVYAALALRNPAPQSIPDELIYSELAKSLGDGHLPSIRDEATFAYGVGYPALLAPIWAIFVDVSEAYGIAKVLNAFVLSLTAIPAYLLARWFVGKPEALAVAGLTILVPSMHYAGLLMTEVVLYPALVLALLAIAHALARPSTWTQLGALAAIAFACSIKMLAAVLFIALVASIGLFQWLDTREPHAWRQRLGDYRTTWATLTGILFAAVAGTVAAGSHPFRILGAYSVVLENIDPVSVPWWVVLYLAELDLYLAVIPFVATTLVVMSALRTSDASSRLFTALTLPVVVCVILTVAAFSSKSQAREAGYVVTEARLYERSTFVLAPLFIIGLAMWLRARRNHPGAIAFVAAAAILLPTLIPIDDFDGNVRVQAVALVPWVAFADGLAWPVGLVVFTAIMGAAGVVVAMRARLPGVAYLLVGVAFVVVGLTAHTSMQLASDWSLSVAGSNSPGWVDQVADDEPVSVLWAEPLGDPVEGTARRHYPLFLGEFFNRSMADVYELGPSLPYALPSNRVRLVGGRVRFEDGRPAALGRFVFVPCFVRLSGDVVAQDSTSGARVYAADRPLRVTVTRPDECA